MSRVKSEFMEIEVWRTTDGEVFTDEAYAKKHQQILDSNQWIDDFRNRYEIDEEVLKELMDKHLEIVKGVR